MQDISAPRIAVIGLGPRGLGAIEALAQRRQDGVPLQIDVFDPFAYPGAGPNFAPDEPDHCLLNIPYRDIAIRPPNGSRIGAFADWLDHCPDPDDFPARANLGRYLEARWADLKDRACAEANITARLIPAAVAQVRRGDSGWHLRSEGQDHGPYDEVLLALGQPAVAPDPQLAAWQDHASKTKAVMAQAYPARSFSSQAAEWHGQRVAIRGLGLSTFDVLRGLTVAQGGSFDVQGYHASGREPAVILPFSLDGQPPYPKPETEALDAGFAPTKAETKAFVEAAAVALASDAQAARAEISTALIAPVLRILAPQQVTRGAIAHWVDQEWQAPGSQTRTDALETLIKGIEMASGARPASIGYTLGQVWRKWQDDWRGCFNPAQTTPELAKMLVNFDEGLKRYSYGPPISAARELRALVAAGLVDLSSVHDPDICLTPAGWTLKTEKAAAAVTVMVDAVLPSPDLAQLSGPLLADLMRQGLLTPLAPGLAAAITADGSLRDAGGAPVRGLCLLGRLALGSVTAVDSLHDCFGQSADRWAAGVLSRLSCQISPPSRGINTTDRDPLI